MNVYEVRPTIPRHWPPAIAEWAVTLWSDERIIVPRDAGGDLFPPLREDFAADWWLPLARLRIAGEVREYVSQPNGFVCIAWPDGSFRIGAPPRTADDLPSLYTCARISLEHFQSPQYDNQQVKERL